MNVRFQRLLAGYLWIFALVSILHGAPADSASSIPSRESTLILEAYHLWSALADEIWPGTASSKAPMIYVGEQHEYAVGFDRSLDGFSDTGATPLGKSVQVRGHSLPLNVSASFPVQGIPAVVIGSPEALGKSMGGWVLTAGHEMFHVFQAANNGYEKAADLQIGSKGDSSWPLNFPFPYGNADAMRLMHLQGYLLWLAAESPTQDDAKYNVGTALDAAHVYRAYLARVTGDDKAYHYSQHQEWNEGVAAYFEYRLAQKAATAYRPTTAYSSLPMFQEYGVLWREAYQSRPYLTKHAGRAAKDRNAFYHLGAGKALALDKIDPGWKKKYFLPRVWLDDLLATANDRANR